MSNVELPPGKAVAGCGACGEIFTCTSAFDKHQTHDYGSSHPTTCHSPSERGLVLYERAAKDDPDNPWLIWGWPAAEDTAWRDD